MDSQHDDISSGQASASGQADAQPAKEAAQQDARKDQTTTLVSQDDHGLGRETARDTPGAPDKKAQVLSADLKSAARTSLQLIAVIAGVAVIGYLLRFIWVGLLPVILAILVSTVLFPITAWLRHHKFPRALAAVTTLLAFLLIFVGIFSAMAPVVSNQGATLVSQAESGINELGRLVEESPVNVDSGQLESVMDDAVNFLKGQASNIATGVMTGVSAASSILVAFVIMLFVTFFIIKDGEKFLPWLRKYTGSAAGWHITELGSRIWSTLAGFIQAQAAVAFVDAALIGLGLWALQVPLAFVIAVVTFFASFIPIIGAVTAGALAVVIALVSNGLTNALLALALIVIVQQVEGNLLQPLLQSKAMGLHAAVVLLSVTIGSTLSGIIGAFLAVPVAATITVMLRYYAEMTGLRSGEIDPDELDISTGEKHKDNDSDGEGPTPRQKVAELFHSMSPQR